MNFSSFIYFIQSGQTKACLKSMMPQYINQIYNFETNWRPIHFACAYGQVDIVNALIWNKCNFNAVTTEKCHGLHLAARYGHLDIVLSLIANYCDIESRTLVNERPIHLACQYGWIEIVKVLVDSGCLINAKTKNKWTPLHIATRYGYSEIVKFLLKNGATTSDKTQDGSTALDLAKTFNHCSTVAILEKLESQQCVEEKNDASIKTTPVLIFNECSYKVETKTDIEWKSIVSTIEERDLDRFIKLYDPKFLSYKDIKSGLGVLDLLIQNGVKEMMSRVLDDDIDDNNLTCSKLHEEHGDKFLDHYHLYRAIRTKNEEQWMKWAKISTINEKFIMTGESFMEIAVQYGGLIFTRMVYEMILERDEAWTKAKEAAISLDRHDIANLIEEREKYLDSRELVRWNRLHIAVHDNRNDVIEYILLKQFVDSSLTDITLNTPLNLALILGHKECATTLFRSTSDSNGKNKFGQTTLHLAIDASMHGLIDDILGSPSDLTTKDMLKLNPLMSAIVRGDKEVIEKILAKQKLMMTDYIKFDKSILDYLWQMPTKETMLLTMRETYFTLCLKMNGALFQSLVDRLNKTILKLTDQNENTLLHISSQLLLMDLSSKIIHVSGRGMVDRKNKDGNTPLHLFLKQLVESFDKIDKKCAEEFITLLLDFKADVLSCNGAGESIMKACFNLNDERIFQRVFRDVANMRLSKTEFLDISQRNWFTTLDTFIPYFKDCALSSVLNESIAFKIMENCSAQTIKALLPPLNDTLLDSVRNEFLVIASLRNFQDVFEFLLQHYQVTDKLLNDGETLLTSLLRAGKYEYCTVLLSIETSINSLVDQRNINGQTALHIAANSQNMEMLEHMLLESLQWDHADNDGYTVLGILLTNISQIVETDKIKEIERIIKIMVRGGQDLYRLGKDGKPIIYNCNNLDLRMKLQRFQKTIKPGSFTGSSEKNVCSICLDKDVNCVLQCGHPFCRDCLSKLDLCPSCREPIQTHLHLYI